MKIQINESEKKKGFKSAIFTMLGLLALYAILFFVLKMEATLFIIESAILIPLAGLVVAYLSVFKKNGHKIKNQKKYTYWLAGISAFLLSVSICSVVQPLYIPVNMFIMLALMSLLMCITQSVRISGITVTVLASAFSIANELLVQVRGTVLSFSDFFALKTAMTVASSYTYNLSFKILNIVLLAVMLIIAFSLCTVKTSSYKKRIFAIATSFAICVTSTAATLLIVGNKPELDRNQQWGAQDKNKITGVFYNLIDNAMNGRYKKPDGYTTEYAESILDRYTADTQGKNPNVIVVMNEAFANMEVLANYTTNEPVMPFYDSLKENTMKGNALVYGFGGGTCNSEFEFLTGLSTAFMPAESYVYLQYLNYKTNSLAWNLDDDLYKKLYIHPYINSNYRRSTIFKLLGFDQFLDGKAFSSDPNFDDEYASRVGRIEYPGVDLVRDYIGDKDVVDRLIKEFEEKDADERIFSYAITMQNHSPYNYQGDDFESNIKVNEGTYNPEFNQYLSLLRMSDNEMKRLVEYFEKVDEDTVIVFFGDHHPHMNFNGLDKTFDTSLEKTKAQHTVPFFVWTNYETEEKNVGDMGLNYLQTMMKTHTGIPLTQMDKFLLDVYEKYPILSSVVVADLKGKMFPSYKMLEDKLLDEYEILQYYFMTENK